MVLLQMLVPVPVAGFGPRIEPVKKRWFLLQVEAEALEMFIPVRVFYHYFGFRVDRFGRVDNQIYGCILHQFQSVVRPAFFPLGIDAQIAFAACKEEVIQDEFIKKPGCIFRDLLHFLPVFGIRITEGLKIIHFVDGVSDTASHFDAPFFEESNGSIQSLLIHDKKVPVGFQVDFIHMNLPGKFYPGLLQPVQIFHKLDFVSTTVNGYFEILISPREYLDGRKHDECYR